MKKRPAGDVHAATSEIDAIEHLGLTPLMRAAANDNTHSLQLLQQRHAKAYKTVVEDQHALHRAARDGHRRLLRALLDAGYSANVEDGWRMTPLMHAAENGNVECVQLLLERGADARKCSNDGCTAAHWAAKGGDLEVLQMLFAADVDLQSLFFCMSVADYALGGGFVDCLSFALACGCRLAVPWRRVVLFPSNLFLPNFHGFYSVPHAL